MDKVCYTGSMKKGFDNIQPKNCYQCQTLIYYKLGEGIREWNSKKFCSRKCLFKYRVRENHPLWKDGLKHRPDGYIRDSATDKYIHRLVMEKKLGRKLKSFEHIHHIDSNPQNNNIKNLRLLTHSTHPKYHAQFRKRNSKGQFT